MLFDATQMDAIFKTFIEIGNKIEGLHFFQFLLRFYSSLYEERGKLIFQHFWLVTNNLFSIASLFLHIKCMQFYD